MKRKPEPTLLEFAYYNQWANQKLLNVCMTIDPNLLSVTIDGSAGSILETLVHIFRAEARFLDRIHGASPQANFEWDNYKLDDLLAYSNELSKEMIDTIKHISPTQNVHEEDDDWSFDYQTRLIYMSLIYHGISHRTDITTFLNQKEVTLPELDIWAYQEEYPERFNAKLQKK